MLTWWVMKRRDCEWPVFRFPAEGGQLQVDYHAGWNVFKISGEPIVMNVNDALELFNTVDIEIYLESMAP